MLHRVSPTHLDTDLLKLSQEERGTAEVTKPHARALSVREATGVLFLMSAPCPLSTWSALSSLILLQSHWPLMVLQFTNNSPASGPLHLPFPLPRIFFLVSLLPVSLSPSICWNVTSESLLTTLSQTACLVTHCSLTLFYFSLLWDRLSVSLL